VTRLVRKPRGSGAQEVFGDPDAGRLDVASLEGFDAVVHLAGVSIAQRWTDAKMRRILDSRETGTRLHARALAALERPPQVVDSASAAGYYGNRCDEVRSG
jgi:NAD dependent epimerase/dehydratase family enzyme